MTAWIHEYLRHPAKRPYLARPGDTSSLWHLNIWLRTHVSPSILSRMNTMAAQASNPFDCWLSQTSPHSNREFREAFEMAPSLPPVTTASLQRGSNEAPGKPGSGHGMRMNPWYRYMINFDIEIFWKPAPHLNASRTPVNAHRPRPTTAYWRALAYEIEVRAFLARADTGDEFTQENRSDSAFQQSSRLLRMFEQLQGILLVARPIDRHQAIREQVDPAHRMYEIDQGRLPDFVYLARWLEGELKNQCSITLDAVVTKLADDMAALDVESDAGSVAGVLQNLFTALETIVLDNTNHVSRSGRATTIMNNDMFFQQHFTKKIQLGIFDPAPSARWYTQGSSSQPPTSTLEHLRLYVSQTMCSLFACIPDRYAMQTFPDSWQYDMANLDQILSGIEMLVATNICVSQLWHLMRHLGLQAALQEASNTLRVRIPAVVGDSAWHAATGNIAAEIVRVASTADEHIAATINEMQILDETEQALIQVLDPTSTVFQEHLEGVRQTLLDQVDVAVRNSYDAEAWQLANRYVAPTTHPRARKTHDASSVENYKDKDPSLRGPSTIRSIVDRLTHILILHWHWAGPLVYALGASGVPDYINDPESRVMAMFDKNLATVPFVHDLVYGGPGAAQRLEEYSVPRDRYLGFRTPKAGEITWDHRYSTGRPDPPIAGPLQRLLPHRHGAEQAQMQVRGPATAPQYGPAAR